MKKKIISFLIGSMVLVGVGFTQNAYAGIWQKDSEGWRYLENGNMETGWILTNGNWYYLDNYAVMKTGWIDTNGTYYYLNSDGILDNSKTTTVMPNEIKEIYDIVSPYKDGLFNYRDMEYVGNDSAPLKEAGLSGKTYYHFCTEDDYGNSISEYFYNPTTGDIYKHNQGIVTLVGTDTTLTSNVQTANLSKSSNWKQTNEGLAYYKDGIRQAGWVQDNDKWYYLNNSGIMQIGWIHEIDKNTNMDYWYYLNNDGSRDDSKTTIRTPDEVSAPIYIFMRQTNELHIVYVNTVNSNGKITMNYEGKDTGNKYYYDVATKNAYCLTNGVLEQFGDKIGDITIINNKYSYEQCKQLALAFFENSHSYNKDELTMSSDQKVDTNGEYHFTFYSISDGEQIDNCYVSSVTGEVRN